MVCRWDGSFLCTCETICSFSVGDYSNNVQVRHGGLGGIDEGLEVGSISGDENDCFGWRGRHIKLR